MRLTRVSNGLSPSGCLPGQGSQIRSMPKAPEPMIDGRIADLEKNQDVCTTF